MSPAALIWSIEIVRPFTATVNVSRTSPRLNVAPFAAVQEAGKSNVVVYVPRPDAFCNDGICGHGFRPASSTSTRFFRVSVAEAPTVVAYGYQSGISILLCFAIATVVAVDAGVRWSSLLGEERPPPGFYEWLFKRRRG